MKKIIMSICFLCAGTFHLLAQSIEVQPIPQKVVTEGETIACPSAFKLLGEEEANPHALKALKNWLNSETVSKEFTIRIGERGDKAVRKYARFIPKKAEGYYLRIDQDEIVLAGNDERGTFYAFQTLRQLKKEGKLPVVDIEDYPSVPFRGVVEGFYGTPWSHEARLRQIRFYGDQKMNTYIYGPKDDPYHSSPNWRLPYPEKEANQLKELVQLAKENEVDFVWAIHPGKDIQWNDEDRTNLMNKFEKMYQLGVRSFAVFFDDISGQGTNPKKQAELLNYLDNEFVKVKKDVTPLIMCPTEYNKSWSNPKRQYLTTLGKELNQSVHIMWTGDRVISDIHEEGMKWVNERIQRPAFIWWNFPVSDYVRDHLLMGPVYGNDTHIAPLLSGFVSNPMEHPEASMIAIYSVASYGWNPANYQSEPVWKKAIQTILPEAAEELEIFAAHNSDLGVNGHKYRRDESVALQPTAASFLKGYLSEGSYSEKDLQTLLGTFDRLQGACDVLMSLQENSPLVKEIHPWLQQCKLTAERGQSILAMVEALRAQDTATFLRKYRQTKGLQKQMFDIDQTFNQNPYQPGIKTATKVIKPLLDQTFAAAVDRYNQQYQAKLDGKTDYMPHQLKSNVAQLKNLPLQLKVNRVQVSPANEVIRWQADGYITIELDEVYKATAVIVNLGRLDLNDWGELELTADGIHWEKQRCFNNKKDFFVNLDHTPVKAVRFKNKEAKEQQTYLRQFTVIIDNK